MFFCESLVILGACMIDAELSNLTISENKGQEITAYSANGTAYDVSRFYDPDYPNIYIEGQFTFDTGTRLTLGFDPGETSDKYQILPTIRVGVNQLIELTDLSWLVVNASTSVGGTEEHTPCVDDEGGRFHCRSLTPWGAFDRPTEHEVPYNLTIQYTKRF